VVKQNGKAYFYIFITLTRRISHVPHILLHITVCQSDCAIQPPFELHGIADMMKDSVRNGDMTTGEDMESFLEIISWNSSDMKSSNDETTLSLREGEKR
jgi:hypothetical protein